MVSDYLLFERQSINLMLAFFVIFTSGCRPQTLLLAPKIRIQVVSALLKICNAECTKIIKIVNGPHSVNAKQILALVRVMGLVYPPGTDCVRNNNLDPQDIELFITSPLEPLTFD